MRSAELQVRGNGILGLKVDQREAMLSKAQADLAAAESRQSRLQDAYADNEKQIGELQLWDCSHSRKKISKVF